MANPTLQIPINSTMMSAVMATIGAKGGKTRSARKSAAARKNVLKAQAARHRKAA